MIPCINFGASLEEFTVDIYYNFVTAIDKSMSTLHCSLMQGRFAVLISNLKICTASYELNCLSDIFILNQVIGPSEAINQFHASLHLCLRIVRLVCGKLGR